MLGGPTWQGTKGDPQPTAMSVLRPTIRSPNGSACSQCRTGGLDTAFHAELSGGTRRERTSSPAACQEARGQTGGCAWSWLRHRWCVCVVFAAEKPWAASAVSSSSSALRGLHYFWSPHFTGLFPACCQCEEHPRLRSCTSEPIRMLLTSFGKELEAHKMPDG